MMMFTIKLDAPRTCEATRDCGNDPAFKCETCGHWLCWDCAGRHECYMRKEETVQ